MFMRALKLKHCVVNENLILFDHLDLQYGSINHGFRYQKQILKSYYYSDSQKQLLDKMIWCFSQLEIF